MFSLSHPNPAPSSGTLKGTSAASRLLKLLTQKVNVPWIRTWGNSQSSGVMSHVRTRKNGVSENKLQTKRQNGDELSFRGNVEVRFTIPLTVLTYRGVGLLIPTSGVQCHTHDRITVLVLHS